MAESGESGERSNFGARTDEPAQEDELGFASYVEAVKTFVTSESTKPPLTISIEGEWGSGKSSFMQQLKSSLDDDQVTVEFNPWKHEKQEAVWAAFALKFLEDIRDESNFCEEVINRVELWGKRYTSNLSGWAQLKAAFTIIAFIVPAIALVSLWIKFGTDIVISGFGLSQAEVGNWELLLLSGGALGAVLTYMRIWSRLRTNLVGSLEQNLADYATDPGYGDRIGFINSFHNDFENILDVYVEDDERVFVFIDDLDRCSVPRAADLMQAINLILSSDDRLVFILGLDRARVAAGMAAKHDELLEVLDDDPTNESSKLGFGYQYLEKFIQIPFLVPEPKEEDIRGLMMGDSDNDEFEEDIGDYWEEILDEYETNLEEIVDMVVPALGSNPRQVKRFMNLYQLRAVLAHVEGVLELGDSISPNKITLPQLAKFVIISIQWPQLISKIYNDPTALDRLIAWREEKEGDIEGLEQWASDPELLDLLDYGESERYDLRTVNVGSLMKISPRVDIPTDSEKGIGSIQKTIQVSHFVEDDVSDLSIELTDMYQDLSNNIRNYTHDLTDSRPKLAKALHSYIWVVNPKVATSNEFRELYESAPSSTTIVLFGENISTAEAEEFENAIFVETKEELKKVLQDSIQNISGDDEKGNLKWEKWRREATDSRDDFLHGY